MQKRAWIISVNMGYGHQRTAFPLKHLAPQGKIINANDYQGIPRRDRRFWEGTRSFYEFISRFSRIPFLGKTFFLIYDQFQKILSFYPKRDLSWPNFSLRQIYNLIKKGWGKDLIETLLRNSKGESLPIISTFFIPAFMAEFFKYPGEIFCIICDADISRSWVALNPGQSRIKYFASTERAAERLKLYGVRPENVILTGYPLPQSIIGTKNLEILKEDLKYKILNLDPRGRYFIKYRTLIESNLGGLPQKSDHPLTIMFSVGGAGAQKEIGVKIIKNLAGKIKTGQLKIILSAGTREKVKDYFEKNIRKLGLNSNLGRNIEIIFEKDIESYFQSFNQSLRKTDVLWTKPSELSFYSVLGLPVIIAPPIGSQEEFNMRWLLKSGFGKSQENPNYTKEWLFDWLEQGYLAECIMEGFIEGEKLGTLNIEGIIAR